ncbi:nucleotidyltransferase domain-containing protein [Candidatus Woesearchaeota archaeon]|nr:nucleotidyltransferase domain-containing protein [Candidatus Woesearchaeota archaeon]
MDKKTDAKIKSFAKIIKNKFNIDKVILFGSRVKGTYRKNSDYDFILVSNDFKGLRFTDRISKIYPYWKYNDSIEPLCYTPEEFNKLKNQATIVREAINEGIEI